MTTASEDRAMPMTEEEGELALAARVFVPQPPHAEFDPAPTFVDPDGSKGWVRRLAPVLRPHRKVVFGSMLASVAVVGFQLAVPQVVRGAIDDALIARSSSIAPYAWALVALAFGMAVFGYVQRFGMQRASVEIEASLRTMLFEHLSRQSFTYYDTVQSGQLISRANSDIRAIQIMLQFIPMLGVSVLMFIAALLLMLQMNVLLTLATMATLPLVFLAGWNMRRKLFPLAFLMMARTADVATVVEENVTGVRVVKSFAGEAGQLSLFDRTARRLRWVSIRMVDNQAIYAPMLQSLSQLSLAVILLVGGKLVIDGSLSIGTLTSFTAYVVMLQAPFLLVGMLMQMAQRAAAASHRVLEVLDATPDMVDAPGAVDLTECTGDVELRHVGFAYQRAGSDVDDEPLVLHDFDLHLRPGETVALVGRTGGGKSTIARLLPRFYDVKKGAVLVDGQDVRGLTLASLRSHIGMVLDEPFLFSDTVRDNIAFGRPDADFADVVAAAKAAGAHDFISALADGYDTLVGERGYTLSGGQRQRIAIARTLVVNPRILILDDATSAIDAQREHEIHGALRTLMQGRTTLIIAHRLSTISLASRVVVLDGGRIVADGTHDQLLRTVPLYREILAHAESDVERAHEQAEDEQAEASREERIARASQATPLDADVGPGGAL